MKLESHFIEIYRLINKSRTKALAAVNTELIDLYMEIGKYISIKISNEEWGKSVVKNLSEYLNKIEPNLKGFSSQNLWRMKQFYEAYSSNQNILPLVREISWTNNMIILSKTETEKEREFYIRLSIKEHLSKRELERQINSSVFERTILSKQKLSPAVREIYPTADKEFKDRYLLDFLSLPETFTEKNLRRSIIKNLKKFILEFGKDFTFVGEEYRIQVGKKDFYIDLLFYHRELQCLVAIELKTTDFKPEYMGKMEFYLEALDNDVKKQHEKPSVGLILCKSKDEKIVEYALNRTFSPTLIAQYKTKLIDKKLLETKLDEFFELGETQE